MTIDTTTHTPATTGLWVPMARYVPHMAAVFAVWGLLLFTGRIVYSLYFHPLRNYPGPFVARATNLWRAYQTLTGHMPQTVKDLHDTYGPVVRIAPSELSFIESAAWKDIYGHHGAYEMAKDDRFYRPMGSYMPHHIINADRAEHSALRRALSHGFSERSMRAQEPVIGAYVDLLLQRLDETAQSGQTAIDMRAWFNFATFDIIGNLGFGSDFGCLENKFYHPWVDAISNNLRDTAYIRVLVELLSARLIFLAQQSGLLKGRKKHLEYSREKVQQRLAMDPDRADLIEGLVRLRTDKGLSEYELELNASILTLAGSETTATLMSGALYLLATHPSAWRQLAAEVRQSFAAESEITLTSVNGLDYMLACLNEVSRLYPPVVIGLPRVVPKGGHHVAGHWVPEDTAVSVWQYAANLSPSNFSRPDEFRPERFMGDPQFAGDDLAAMQPFSVGPRNCIGRNLAYAEMRLIIARIAYRFDIELAPEGRDWIKRQKVYGLWEKPELPIYLKPVERSS